jgi:hypothetical protein
MNVKELIEKLSKVDPETEVYWEDIIEGNDCEVGSVYLCPKPKCGYKQPPDPDEIVVYISPREDGEERRW